MKKLIVCSLSTLILNSCMPTYSSYPVTNSTANTEREYQEV